MLTVKSIDGKGAEYLQEAESVTFCPKDGVTAFLPAGVCATFPIVNEAGPEVGHPMVYVMNRFGATVAKYEL